MLASTLAALGYPLRRQILISVSRTLTTQDVNAILQVDSAAAPRTVSLMDGDGVGAGGYFYVVAPFGTTNSVTVIFPAGNTYNQGKVGSITLSVDDDSILVVAGQGKTWNVFFGVASGSSSITADSVTDLQALSDAQVSVGSVAEISRTGNTWICTATTPLGSTWHPSNGLWNALDFASAKTGATIQLAINACATGGYGTVFVPTGTWTITTALVLVAVVDLVGADRITTILKGAGIPAIIQGTNTAWSTTVRNIYGSICHMTIDDTSAPAGSVGIDARQWTHLTVDDVEVKNCEVGIRLDGIAYYNVISRVRVSACVTGMTVKDGSRANTVYNSRFSSLTTGIDIAGGASGGLAPTSPSAVNDLIIIGCEFASNTTAIIVDGTVTTVTTISTYGCRYEANTQAFDVRAGATHVSADACHDSNNTNWVIGTNREELDYLGRFISRYRGVSDQFFKVDTPDDMVTEIAQLFTVIAGEGGHFDVKVIAVDRATPTRMLLYTAEGFAYENGATMALSGLVQTTTQLGGSLAAAAMRTTVKTLYVDGTREVGINYRWYIFATWRKNEFTP